MYGSYTVGGQAHNVYYLPADRGSREPLEQELPQMIRSAATANGRIIQKLTATMCRAPARCGRDRAIRQYLGICEAYRSKICRTLAFAHVKAVGAESHIKK